MMQSKIRKDDDVVSEELSEQLRQTEQLAAVGQLACGVAHDFNNLLTIIIGNLQVADAASSRQVQTALQAALRGAALTRKLLSLSAPNQLPAKPVDVNGVVTELAWLLDRVLGRKIRVDADLDPGLWAVDVDTGLLENALINLAANARDAMPNGGSLNIQTRNLDSDQAQAMNLSGLADRDYVLVTVSDSGVGIPQNLLPRVMEPFFSTKGPGKGTGLGLSMVSDFVEQCGGKIQIESVEALGTSLRLLLPRQLDYGPSTTTTVDEE